MLPQVLTDMRRMSDSAAAKVPELWAKIQCCGVWPQQGANRVILGGWGGRVSQAGGLGGGGGCLGRLVT